MGYEMGLSIYKVNEQNVPTEEVALISFWCSQGRGIADFIRSCIHKPLEEMTILKLTEVEVIKHKLDSMYSGSDIIGETAVQYILKDCDNYEYENEVIARAKEIGVNPATALTVAKNFFNNNEDMYYSTFLDFKKDIDNICNIKICDGYELFGWISE